MDTALALAGRGLGTVWPNPAVGCVLTRDGVAVGRGWTQPGGRPHAETEAIRRAGGRAAGATAYVSLEPCDHHGQTPPCSQALIDAGIARCVIALRDPDPRVSGKGAARLRAAGIAVVEGVCGESAAAANRGYLLHRTIGRPLVTWKAASTLDGRIATRTGDSRWITGETARAQAHLLRARHDAVLVGARTACVDRPRLTCRLPGLAARSPVRVVIDGTRPLPSNVPPAADGAATWVVCRDDAERARLDGYESRGFVAVRAAAEGEGEGVSVAGALRALAERGITRLLVEGGGRIAASLLRARLVDRIEWFRAPSAIGGDGIAAAGPLALDSVADAPRFRPAGVRRMGEDLLESYVVVA